MKILIKIQNDKLRFINRKKLNPEYKNMLNTNVISNNELIFSDEYIKFNSKIVWTFLNELIKTYSITTLSFQNNEIVDLILPFIHKIKYVSSFYLESNEVLTYKCCERVSKLDNIKYISAEYIPPYMFELLDKYGVIPESRNEILFTSYFMESNSLNTYSSLFYKTNIILKVPLNESDIEDFNVFCDINRHLKIIHINKPNKEDLEKIILILKNNNQKNIKIIIHGDVHNPHMIEYLKNNNKIIKKKYKLSFKIKYSKEYIEENILKETNNNILRMCGLLILAIILFSIGYVLHDNYRSMKKVSKIQKEIIEYINSNDTPDVSVTSPNPHIPKITNTYLYSLTSINPDVVGWLKVNGTNIDYAIVQTINNDFYLEHNLYKEKDENGWLFMNTANNPYAIDDNIIIFGHNRYLNGVMFGTLNKTLYKSWYTNPDNQIISFDTLYGSYEYQVFSIYIVPTTDDYLDTNFLNSDDKLKFLDLIKKRSIYDFKIDLDEKTKIITLSTCQSETTRLVLHAKLINEKTDVN